MSLRSRLTVLYTALTGGILLLFGVLIYFFVNILQVTQIDDTLIQTYQDVLKGLRVNQNGDIVSGVFSNLYLSSNINYQLWNTHGKLALSSPNLGVFTAPLDTQALESSTSIYTEVKQSLGHLRVLTIPLETGGRSVGVLQLSASLDLVDATNKSLLEIILFSAVTTMVIAAAASWFSIGRALLPLSGITRTALKISRTNDFSQRIPHIGSEKDETGRLISAFNETLDHLEQNLTSQQRFLADISHELRTPLTVIKGNVDLMRHLKKMDDESLDSIEEESDRLTRLVGNLLLEAQADSGQLPLQFAPVELDTLLLEVHKDMRILARDRVNLKLNEIDQIMVNGDRDRLKQVLINLVANAIKFTHEKGDVFLSLGKVGENARLIVRDTGQGIPQKDLPHIFERFYQADKSRTRSKATGFGLGLSIAHWIIEHHGGRIEVDSSVGKGSTFCIYLPILTNTVEEIKGASPDDHEPARKAKRR